ncbi:hypothetical protein MLD38_031195 [Melastoma candidum]|uniref:Uncharacterized protein n=1 Tax=Melastoma candidum TaxID=119954 RepID=A0ACB9MSH8_9MYRT|nr:hypothetical protein MLD38_031195 [Melastoma candidum]
MSPALSSPLALHRFRPCSPPVFPVVSRKPMRWTSGIRCQTSDTDAPQTSSPTGELIADTEPKASPVMEQTNEAPSGAAGLLPELPTKDVNRNIAILSTLAAVGLFLSSRLDFGVSLKDLAAVAMPYEEALSNGKPTVVEFYADWCEVCRELAPDVYKVEQQYKNQVNFVMLNVDNTKWEQELDEFGVEGIPHFAFLDKEGNEEGNVVGKLPRQYFLDNVEALARGEERVPHARVVGQYSSAEARRVHQVADPRSHG